MPYDPNELARPRSLMDRAGTASKYALATPALIGEMGAGLVGMVHGGTGMLLESAQKALGGRPNETYEDIATRAREREAAPTEWARETLPFGAEADEMLQKTIGGVFNYLNTTGEQKGQEVVDITGSPLMGAFVETSFKALPYLGLEAVGMRAVKGTKGAVNAVRSMGELVDTKAIQNSLAVPKPKGKPSPRYVEFDENAPASKIDVSPELQADRLGVKYDGSEEIAPGHTIHWYTDPVTESTFIVTPGKTLEEVLAVNRKKFAEPEPINPELPVEDQLRQVDEGMTNPLTHEDPLPVEKPTTPPKIEDVLAEHTPEDINNASYITQQGKPVGDMTNGHAATLETVIAKMGWGDELFHQEDLGRAEATKRSGLITRIALDGENIFVTSSEHMSLEAAKNGASRFLRDAGIKDGVLEFDGEQQVVKAAKGKPEVMKPVEEKATKAASNKPTQKKGWRKKPAPSDPLEGTKADMTLGEIMGKPASFMTSDQLGRAVEANLAKGNQKGFLKAAATYAAQAATRNTVRLAKKLAGDLTVELPNDIHYAYREMIDTLRDGIDPTFRSEKTMTGLKRTKKFLEENPEMLQKMPDRIIKILSKKSIKDMTLRDLHEVHEQIFNKDSGLVKLGQLRYKLEQAKRTRARETVVSELNETLAGQKDTKSYLETGSSSTTPANIRKQTWKDRLTDTKLSTLIPQQVFDILDGGKNFAGAFHRTLYKMANSAVSEEMRMARRSVDAGSKRLEELGLNWHHWNARSKVDGIDLSRQEMLQVYLGWKNQSHRTAIMENRGITESQAQAIIRNLTEQEKAFGDFILKDNAESAPRINRALQHTSNTNLSYESNYSTIVYDGDAFHNLTFEEKLGVEMEVRRLAKKAAPSSSFVRERLGNAQNGARLNMNAVDNWLSHVTKREHYIANASYVKEMGKVFSDPRVVESIRQKHGQPAVDYIRNYLNDIANPSLFRDMSKWAQMSRILRRNTATAYIALNPTSILMQTASLPKYFRDAGITRVMASLAKFVTNAPAMYKRICEMEPQIRDRFFEREAAEMGELHKTQAGRALETLQNAGMWPTKMMDKIMVIVGYDAVYNRYLPKLGEAGARAKALETTLRTQSATHPKDMAPLYKTNEAFNWALMFTNDLSKTWGEAIHTLPADIKAGRLREAGYTMAGMGTMAIIAWSIAHKAIPNSPADIADAFTEQSLSTVPMVGNLMMAKKAGYGDSSAPVMNALSLPGTLLSDASDKTKARQTGEAISVLLGLPFTATRKAAKAIKEEDPMKLLGEPRANTFETGDGIAVRRSSTRNSRPGRYSGRGGRRYLR